ncbi:MAG: CHASE2 domain-containing protein [Synechococcaceae cyanobacterium SM1_2_3]|nr:CHASE2 domain-containing protein [Synechococcaceae cyanobacterium SM1_2_3]
MAHRLQWGPFCVVLTIAALVWLLVNQGPLRPIENWLGDLRIALMTPRQPPSDHVVLLTLTEDTLHQFPYRSPINRAFLAKLIATLNHKGVRAIGLDILFDRPTEAAADQALAQALRHSAVPVVVAYADRDQVTAEQQRFLDQFTSGLRRGYADLLADGSDGVIRTVFPGQKALSGEFIRGLAIEVAGVPPPDSEMLLHYRGLPPEAGIAELHRTFKKYPAHLAEALPAAWLQGRIVLVGADVLTSREDLQKTPFVALLGNQQGLLPGVMVQAHIVTQMLEGRHLPIPPLWLVLVLYGGCAALGAALTRLDWPVWLSLSLIVTALGAFWALGFWWYQQGGALLPLIGPSLALLGAAWWFHAHFSRQERRQKRFIKNAFGRYLHPDWVEQLMANPDLLRLQGERRELTVLFTDVADFTTISEALPPTSLVHVLSQYLDGMTQIIMAHGGAVNKYMGDGIMVLFGAPVIQADHAQRAVRCALALDEFAEAFRRQVTDPDGQPVNFGQTRIGVHTGEATVGNVGSAAKIEYTAIGDVVNAASRLEGLNRYFGTRIAVSGATRSQVMPPDASAHELRFRPMGQVVVKGKREAFSVFNPLVATAESVNLLDEYAEAYYRLEAGDLRAVSDFLALRNRYSGDPLVNFYWQRVNEGEYGTRVNLSAK